MKYLPCTYDEWDEAYRKTATPSTKKAKEYTQRKNMNWHDTKLSMNRSKKRFKKKKQK